MPTNPPVELVIFDAGGVMVRLAKSWQDACARAGVPYPQIVMQPQVAAQVRAVIDPSERGHITQEEFDERVGGLIGLEPAALSRVSAQWLVGPYPGIEQLIERLCGNGVKLACLSNTNERHWAIMTGEGFHASLPVQGFSHLFASHLVGMRKPEPGIYEHVERETGIAPASILFFDDRPDNTAAAEARGWQTLTIDPTRPVEQMTQHLIGLGLLDAD